MKGDGTLVQPAAEATPSSVRSYAPASNFKAYFPHDVLHPEPELFTPTYKIYGTGGHRRRMDAATLAVPGLDKRMTLVGRKRSRGKPTEV